MNGFFEMSNFKHLSIYKSIYVLAIVLLTIAFSLFFHNRAIAKDSGIIVVEEVIEVLEGGPYHAKIGFKAGDNQSGYLVEVSWKHEGEADFKEVDSYSLFDGSGAIFFYADSITTPNKSEERKWYKIKAKIDNRDGTFSTIYHKQSYLIRKNSDRSVHIELRNGYQGNLYLNCLNSMHITAEDNLDSLFSVRLRGATGRVTQNGYVIVDPDSSKVSVFVISEKKMVAVRHYNVILPPVPEIVLYVGDKPIDFKQGISRDEEYIHFKVIADSLFMKNNYADARYQVTAGAVSLMAGKRELKKIRIKSGKSYVKAFSAISEGDSYRVHITKVSRRMYHNGIEKVKGLKAVDFQIPIK